MFRSDLSPFKGRGLSLSGYLNHGLRVSERIDTFMPYAKAFFSKVNETYYIYAHIPIHLHTHTYLFLCVCVCVFLRVRLCIWAHMCVCVCHWCGN